MPTFNFTFSSSEEACEEAKNTLKRRFEGKRNRLQNYLGKLRKLNQFKKEIKRQKLEKCADTSVSTAVALFEYKRHSELESVSFLFTGFEEHSTDHVMILHMVKC